MIQTRALVPLANNYNKGLIGILAAAFLFLIDPLVACPSTQASGPLSNISPTTIATGAPTLYKVKVENGQYCTVAGAHRTYTLYIPEANANLPGPPYPMVVFIHGFLMSGQQHSNNAEYLAQRGIIALTPDLTRVLLGDDTRMENVGDVLAEIRWLTEKSKGANAPLDGLVDANRIGIAGNSAGGAVCLELLREAQKAKVRIMALCSLDGVPWDRTWDHMSQLEPTSILSLRAEPGLCNYHARILRYLALLKFPFDDVKVNGAHHCDVENPSTFGCKCVCGTSNDKYRRVFQHLTYLFMREALHSPALDSPGETFVSAVQSLETDGKVAAQLYQRKPSEIAGKQQVQ
jgi:hypothetical protein